MIEFTTNNNNIFLVYQNDGRVWHWSQNLYFNAFRFSESDLKDEADPKDTDYWATFILATKEGKYYRIPSRILGLQHDLYIYQDIQIKSNFFVTSRNALVFPRIDKIIGKSFYIGGKHPDAISYEDFLEIIDSMPKKYELDKYVDARISSILSEYFDTGDTYERKYQQYLSKKISKKEKDISSSFFEVEIKKYQLILKKLESMLNSNVGSYNEAQWQKQILDILLLLYP